jgi:hypothetical protein
MFQSKALKDYRPKRSKLYMWWIQTSVSEYVYDFFYKFFKKPYRQLKKLYGWQVNVFWQDYDFDSHSIFIILEYKLKRIEKALIHGHAYQEPKDMKALKLAIKLAGRLREDKYEERGYDRIDAKWGESKHWFEPCNDGSGNSTMHSSRSKVNTPEEKEQEMAYRRKQYELSDARRQKENRWLYAIMLKYMRSWWD